MTYNIVTGTGMIIFTGSLEQCWHYLVITYGHISVSDLAKTGIKIQPAY